MIPYVVPEAKAMSFKAINDAANRLLMRHCQPALQGRSHFDVMGYLEFHLVKEHETDYRISDSLPLGTWAESRLKLVVLSEGTYYDAMRDDGFARFTVAHEIGHVVLHQYLMMQKRFHSSQLGNGGCVLFTRGQLEAFRDPEWQANQFAAALLMPVSGMISLRQRYTERALFLNNVTETFRVSASAAKYRLDTLIKKGKIAF